MHASRTSSSSYPASRSISADRISEISATTSREPTGALEPHQEIARIASFHSPRHFEVAGGSHSTKGQEHESLRSDMPNMTASATSSYSGQSIQTTRHTAEGLEPEPRRRPNSREPQLQPSDALTISSPQEEDGGLKILMQPPTPNREPSPEASSGSGSSLPPWKSPPMKKNINRSRSPKDKPSLTRDARSRSPQTGTPATIRSTAAQALSTEFTLQIRTNSPIRSESPTQPSPTSQSTPPRSPVISPRPRNLLLGSISPVRERSPARRTDSPLAQSISPQPGFIAESGNGILSPRLSPIPSPMASPGSEIPNPLSPRGINKSLLARVDSMEYSSDGASAGEQDYFHMASSESTPTGTSPMQSDDAHAASESSPMTNAEPLHISVPDQDADGEDYDMVENEGMMDEDQQQAMFLDDEGLTALEKIYLFSRSTFSFHRSYISKQLPFLIRDVPPTEAVDYVCPLLNGLGTDPEESVKEVFVQELVPIIWWFFTQCQLYDHQLPEPPPVEGITYLPADAFTPLIGSLLLSANPRVGDGARLAIVDLINRLQVPESVSVDDRFCEPSPTIQFDEAEKAIIMNEIMNGVVLGMGRLDTEFQEGGSALHDAEQAIGGAYDDAPRSGAPSPEDMSAAFDDRTGHPSADAEQFIYSPQVDEVMDAPVAAPAASDKGFYGTFVRMPGQSVDDDGWISSMPRTPDEELAQLGSSIQPLQELGTIEEEPAANDTGDEATVGRVASMSVVAAIAANATMPLNMQEVFVQEVWRVGSDSVYWVRREASFAIGALAKVVPLEMVETYLLPLYKSLVEDEQWHVRHSILFALPGILARVDAAQRRSLTVPSLVHLSRDPSDPVRSGLLEVLGEVIYTFRDDPQGPPRELLQLFIQDRDWSLDDRSSPAPSQSFHSPVDWFSDPERPIICAFNFPAVIYTVGAKRWPEVRNYYLHLAKFPTAKVLRTLAASLGEVAAIIGSAFAETDLIPIFLSSLRSTEPEVRAKIIEALPKFVGTLSESRRESIITELSSVWLELGGWREREDLARLLGELVSLSGNNIDSVVEIMSKALRDEVAAVREAAISSVPAYLKALRETGAFEKASADIQSLSNNEKYRQRVTFVSCALSLTQAAKNTTEFEALPIWNSIIMLAQDPIVDVRIGVARLVANATERLYPKRRRRWKLMATLLGLLGADDAPQVRSFVSFLIDSGDLSTPQGSSYNESGFAIFSKPPRTTNQRSAGEAPSIDNQIDDIVAAVAEKMDLDQPVSPVSSNVVVTPSEPSGETSSSTQGPFVVPSSPSSTSHIFQLRPPLVNVDSTETTGSGTSRGEESQSPRPNEGDSPRHRTGKSRRKNLMTLSDLPQGIELTEAYQAGLLNTARLTPSPGSERRISFDALSSHSDGSDSSSGRMDAIPIARRRSLHRISSDPSVSVASG